MRSKTYFFIVSFLVTTCLICGFLGVCIAYENTVKTAYGEYQKAVEISGEKIRVLDFEFEIPK